MKTCGECKWWKDHGRDGLMLSIGSCLYPVPVWIRLPHAESREIYKETRQAEICPCYEAYDDGKAKGGAR